MKELLVLIAFVATVFGLYLLMTGPL